LFAATPPDGRRYANRPSRIAKRRPTGKMHANGSH
jgi:hypothetical protein